MKAITIISFTLQLGFALHYFGKFFREFFDGKVRSWLPQYDRLTSVALVIFLGLHIFSFEYLKGDIIISLTLLIFTIVLILFTKKRKNKDCQQAHIFKIEEIDNKGRVNTFIYLFIINKEMKYILKFLMEKKNGMNMINKIG